MEGAANEPQNIVNSEAQKEQNEDDLNAVEEVKLPQ